MNPLAPLARARRIRRIRQLQRSPLLGSVHMPLHRREGSISNEAKVHFGLTFAAWLLLSQLTRPLVPAGLDPRLFILWALPVALGATAVADLVMDRVETRIDRTLWWLGLGLGLLFLAAVGIWVASPDLRRAAGRWHESINESLQLRHRLPVQGPTEGPGYRFLVDGNAFAKVTWEEAEAGCRALGNGWRVVDADALKRLEANPRTPWMTVWVGPSTGAQIGGKQPWGQAFSGNGSVGRTFHHVLCLAPGSTP